MDALFMMYHPYRNEIKDVIASSLYTQKQAIVIDNSDSSGESSKRMNRIGEVISPAGQCDGPRVILLGDLRSNPYNTKSVPSFLSMDHQTLRFFRSKPTAFQQAVTLSTIATYFADFSHRGDTFISL